MISSVLSLVLRSSPAAKGIDVFSKLLLQAIAGTRLGTLSPEQLAAFAGSAFEFLSVRSQGRHKIRVAPFESVRNGGSSPATLVEILTNDMPFVADSVMGEIRAQGLVTTQILRPIFKAHRYASERLREVFAAGDDNWADGQQECYLAILVEPMLAARMPALAAVLDIVLADVRAAVTDDRAMRNRLAEVIDDYQALPRVPDVSKTAMQTTPSEVLEAIAFLKWLTPETFITLGTRDYDMVGVDQKVDLWPSSKGALGLLRNPKLSVPLAANQLGPRQHQVYFAPAPITISKASSICRVYRRQPYDYIGMKRYSPDGRLVGELRVIGLFTPAAYLQTVKAVPIARRNVHAMLTECGPTQGHRARTLLDALEVFPRDELMQASRKQLIEWTPTILDLELRPRTSVLARRDTLESFMSVVVFVARERYTADAHRRIEELLSESYGGPVTSTQSTVAGPMARLCFTIDSPPSRNSAVATADLERSIDTLVLTWQDHLASAIAHDFGPERSELLRKAYLNAFPADYQSEIDVPRAVLDMARMEKIDAARPVSVDLYRKPDDAASAVRMAYFRLGDPVALTERLPLFESVGLRLVDERTYRLTPRLDGGSRHVTLHDMALRSANGQGIDLAGDGPRMLECLMAIHGHEVDGDPYNALVHAAGASWLEAARLRACGAYLHQAEPAFGKDAIATALSRHADIARDLLRLLAARFDPDVSGNLEVRGARANEIRAKIDSALRLVADPDERGILAALASLIGSVVRTNFYQRDASGRPPEALAFKLDGGKVDGLPGLGSFREIWVHSLRMEGVFLRNGPIARGGIRAASRPYELRKEAATLCRMRQAERAGVAACGAQGVFAVRNIQQASAETDASREAARAFLTAVLGLTDSIGKDGNLPPARVVCWDAADPYLVLEADRETAPYADVAREVAASRGFWLADTFLACGAGTQDTSRAVARGLWQSVRRHFTELGVDALIPGLSSVAAGSLSDRVLAATLLAEPSARLVAAFDDRHILIDPDPDRALALAERGRLAKLDCPGWESYDPAKISTGGGVFSRSADSIVLSSEMRKLLGTEVEAIPPDALVRAVLSCSVDVLWLAPSRPIVRASAESDADLGDPAGTAVRVSASEIRAKAVVEAGPGATQKARIELARRGTAVNTWLIDGACGPAVADREVNSWIALAEAVAAGRLTSADRDAMLADTFEDAASLALADCRADLLTLSLAVRMSKRDLGDLAALARDLEAKGAIDRKRDQFPAEAELEQRRDTAEGLTRPELAVLLCACKNELKKDLLSSSLPDDASLEPMLMEYFPSTLRKRCAGEISGHRLRREILASRTANTIVDFGGLGLVSRLAATTRKSREEIASAVMGALQIFGLPETWREIDALDGKLTGSAQLDAFAWIQDLLFEASTSLLEQPRHADVGSLVATFKPGVQSLNEGIQSLITSRQAAAIAAVSRELAKLGVPKAPADRMAGFAVTREVLRVEPLARQAGRPINTTARILFATQELFKLDKIEARAASLKVSDRYDKLAIDDAIRTLQAAKQAVLRGALAEEKHIPDLAAWASIKIAGLRETRTIIDEIAETGRITISQLSLAASHVKGAAEMGSRLNGGTPHHERTEPAAASRSERASTRRPN